MEEKFEVCDQLIFFLDKVKGLESEYAFKILTEFLELLKQPQTIEHDLRGKRAMDIIWDHIVTCNDPKCQKIKKERKVSWV